MTQPDTTIVFENPPQTGARTRNLELASIAAQLREHPGQWARIKNFASRGGAGPFASRITHGRLGVWQPEGAYEGTVRAVDGEFRVYARYVGTQSTGGAQ